MKIIAISGSEIPSIVANSIQTMKAVHALALLGHDVTLIVPMGVEQHYQSEWSELSQLYGLKKEFVIEFLPSASRRLFFFSAIRRAKKLSPDLIYVWPLQSAVLGLFLNLPVILEMHDLPTGRIGPLWFRYFRDSKGTKRITSITKALKQSLVQQYGEQLNDIETVIAPNGVELERFKNLPDKTTARWQAGLPEKKTVICTGHLYAGRGVDLFIKLAQAFVDKDVQFVWVGGNESEISWWQKKAESVSNVIFTGFIPNNDLPLYQAAADILLMPYEKNIGISSGKGHSSQVSSPMKMFEYLASGRPIISSDFPVFHEVLNSGNAVFCPAEQVDAWEKAITDLLNDPDRQQKLSDQALLDAEKYTWTERAKKILTNFPK